MRHKPSKEQMCKIPGLYTTQDFELQDKLIYLHFYLLDSHWWVCESDRIDTFYGFVVLNGSIQNAEWRYFTLWKLQQYNVKGFEVSCDSDYLWQVKRASQIPLIAKAHGWCPSLNHKSIQTDGGLYV
jgi:hypothetical protein